MAALGKQGAQQRADRDRTSDERHGLFLGDILEPGVRTLGLCLAYVLWAQSKGLPWVGYDSNAKKFAPTSWLTAAVYNWGPYYLKQVKGAMNGTWKTGSYYGSMKDGFTGIAPFGPKVSAKTKAAIAAKKSAIIPGKFYEFQGPIYDQAGKLRVP